MDWYAGLLRQYGPPGSVNFNWNEALAAFAQGQVAQFFDGANFAIQFEDKDKSKIAGKVGYAQCRRDRSNNSCPPSPPAIP